MTKSINIDKEKSYQIGQMLDDLQLYWNRVALIGNWGHQNFWDELILIGNIKLINDTIFSKKKNSIYNRSAYNISWKKLKFIIYSANTNWLSWFHNYFNLPKSNLVYTQEIPHGFRSFASYISNLSNIKDIRYWFTTDTYILGGGEIFTPETPFSYQYWAISLMPYFFGKMVWWIWWYRPKLIVMWGIQKPTRRIDRMCFWFIWRCADRFYLRDKESVAVVQDNRPHKQCSLFVDSSYFAVCDIKKKDY